MALEGIPKRKAIISGGGKFALGKHHLFNTCCLASPKSWIFGRVLFLSYNDRPQTDEQTGLPLPTQHSLQGES